MELIVGFIKPAFVDQICPSHTSDPLPRGFRCSGRI